jgi:hypothetical protein
MGWENPGGGSGAVSSARTIFDQILSAPAANMDSGVIVPAGLTVVEFFFQGASDNLVGVTLSGPGLQLNGDVGANYAWESLADVGTGAFGAGTYNGSSLAVGENSMRMNFPGASAGAGTSYMAHGRIYNYDQTTFNKIAIITHGIYDPTTGANARSRSAICYWANTAAVTRLVATAGAGHNFITGSRFTISVR